MKIKKLSLALMFSAILLVGVFALSACGDDLPDNSGGVEITLIVLDLGGTNRYEKTHSTTKSSLLEVLKEFDELEVSSTANKLGAYINSISIGTIEEGEFGQYFSENLRLAGSSLDGTYIAVYHDIDDIMLKDLSPYALDLTHGEVTYFYSGVHIGMLPLYDGATYVLKLASY